MCLDGLKLLIGVWIPELQRVLRFMVVGSTRAGSDDTRETCIRNGSARARSVDEGITRQFLKW
ncbi:hypothetical protein PAXRUDRAFT_829770 [Paxillus rubicundulus Ve08.2h10]|uniref:Uncharacterized protein n=1 Tax=Paxillus rubicundulus Ve08.2h10 TaxID=930991 RepID=A0A0D0DM53_9AGAM|nr:hypothetical protein PAXRUDRAFT_829770 [Paxillus rubicundulus Ve08.2h10]